MVENDRGRVEEPQACENCQAKECMELVINRCEYSNKQIVRMQVGMSFLVCGWE
jgi:DNA replicative helicase MCM subunit Mcm2 (Cdc46/Mcm family)